MMILSKSHDQVKKVMQKEREIADTQNKTRFPPYFHGTYNRKKSAQ
jgi:hypothetical protein